VYAQEMQLKKLQLKKLQSERVEHSKRALKEKMGKRHY